MMAKTIRIDELNILDYFSEMNLPQEEIDKRISLALLIKEMYVKVFADIKDDLRLGYDIEAEYIEDVLVGGYAEIFNNSAFGVNRANVIAKETITATLKHIDDNYYLSDARATVIAVNDANAVCNYEYEQAFKAKGYKRKRWDAMQDERVRHSHVMADGQEVGIDEMFSVGTSKMRFPMDFEYGSANECVNCRCVCQYLSGV